MACPTAKRQESSSHGQVPGLCIGVIMQFHEFRRGFAPGELRRDDCQHGMVRTAADRPPSPRLSVSALRRGVLRRFSLDTKKSSSRHRLVWRGPRTVVKSTSVFACFEPLGGPCSCLMKQKSVAKIRSTPLDRLSEAIPCEVLAYLCLREQESFLIPHIAPASRAIDASPSLSLSVRVKCIRLMLCLSFYEWRCIYSGEQMLLAPFLGKSSLDRAPGRFADYLFVPKHAKADVLLTTVLGPLRWSGCCLWECCVTAFALEFSCLSCSPILSTPGE